MITFEDIGKIAFDVIEIIAYLFCGLICIWAYDFPRPFSHPIFELWYLSAFAVVLCLRGRDIYDYFRYVKPRIKRDRANSVG